MLLHMILFHSFLWLSNIPSCKYYRCKESACNAGVARDAASIPGLGISSRGVSGDVQL